MDFKTELYNRLLSEDNINYLVGIILSKYRISDKATPKCYKMIYNNLSTYLNNVNRYPQDNEELLQAINFLNQKCHDDFITYLSNKYPKINLSRAQPVNEPIITNIIYPNEPNSKKYNECTYLETPESNITIITQEEYDNLVKKNKQNLSKSDDFFSYMTNPLVLQMLSMITNQNIKTNSKPNIIFDEILDHDQVQKLLSKKTTENIKQSQELNENLSKNNVIEKSSNNNNSIPDNNKLKQQQNNNSVIFNDLNIEKIYDLDPLNLTTDDLLFLNNETKKLISLKNKYFKEDNHDMISEIDKKINIIRDKVTKHGQKLESDVKNTKNKLQNIITKSLENNSNMDELNLEIDPTIDTDELKNNNYNDLKDIKIELKTDKKITEISLMNYFIPSNKKILLVLITSL
ncbi:low complexity protein [Moumouvirus goulette]|uniref:Low complexity protein n=1 Tax=Moumouvirus goulette TaxID=1247379 RepID=M1PWY8_9VIRU|nr:low complexity protein [Moumouvirus goulette]AGF85272.1 low complexity protein [Moumouvirus goulette]